MPDLKFFDRFNMELAFELESNCYSIAQYQKWFVRVLSDSAIVPHIKAGGRLIPMSWDIGWMGFVLPRDDWDIRAHVIGMSGRLILYDLTGQELTPSLYLAPDSISDEEFAEILDRLGQLAIAHESGVLAPVTVLRDAGVQTSTERRFSTRAEVFEHLAQVVNDNWGLIKKNPAKEIRLAPKVIDLSNSQTPNTVRSIYQSAQKPHQRRQQILDRQETYDSPENRFLVYVLRDILLPRAKPLAEYLRSQASKVLRIQMQPASMDKHTLLFGENVGLKLRQRQND